MRVSPAQYARVVAAVGVVLWRQLVTAGKSSSSSSSGSIQISLRLAHIRQQQQLAGFAAQSDSHMQLAKLLPGSNRNLHNHLAVVCKLLTNR